jgi:hypothetical protein
MGAESRGTDLLKVGTYTAGEDIILGDWVGLDPSGNLSKVTPDLSPILSDTMTSTSTSIKNSLSSSSSFDSCWLDETNNILLAFFNSSSYTMYVRAGDFSPSDGTITWRGDDATSIGSNIHSSYYSYNICRAINIDTNKAAVFFMDSSAARTYCRIVTFDPNTNVFTIGDVVDCSGETAYTMQVCKLETDKFAVAWRQAYNTAGNYYLKVKCATVSGTTVTLGDVYQSGQPCYFGFFGICSPRANQLVILYPGDASNNVSLEIMTVSGTTMAYQSWATAFSATYGTPGNAHPRCASVITTEEGKISVAISTSQSLVYFANFTVAVNGQATMIGTANCFKTMSSESGAWMVKVRFRENTDIATVLLSGIHASNLIQYRIFKPGKSDYKSTTSVTGHLLNGRGYTLLSKDDMVIHFTISNNLCAYKSFTVSEYHGPIDISSDLPKKASVEVLGISLGSVSSGGTGVVAHRGVLKNIKTDLDKTKMYYLNPSFNPPGYNILKSGIKKFPTSTTLYGTVHDTNMIELYTSGEDSIDEEISKLKGYNWSKQSIKSLSDLGVGKCLRKMSYPSGDYVITTTAGTYFSVNTSIYSHKCKILSFPNTNVVVVIWSSSTTNTYVRALEIGKDGSVIRMGTASTIFTSNQGSAGIDAIVLKNSNNGLSAKFIVSTSSPGSPYARIITVTFSTLGLTLGAEPSLLTGATSYTIYSIAMYEISENKICFVSTDSFARPVYFFADITGTDIYPSAMLQAVNPGSLTYTSFSSIVSPSDGYVVAQFYNNSTNLTAFVGELNGESIVWGSAQYLQTAVRKIHKIGDNRILTAGDTGFSTYSVDTANKTLTRISSSKIRGNGVTFNFNDSCVSSDLSRAAMVCSLSDGAPRHVFGANITDDGYVESFEESEVLDSEFGFGSNYGYGSIDYSDFANKFVTLHAKQYGSNMVGTYSALIESNNNSLANKKYSVIRDNNLPGATSYGHISVYSGNKVFGSWTQLIASLESPSYLIGISCYGIASAWVIEIGVGPASSESTIIRIPGYGSQASDGTVNPGRHISLGDGVFIEAGSRIAARALGNGSIMYMHLMLRTARNT